MASSFTDRMVRAAKLDPNLYEEVEADRSALGQAVAVVVISSVCAGIGSLAVGGVPTLIMGTIAALVGWFIWAGLIYLIGGKLLPAAETQTDMGELLRTLGFASAPGVLRIVAFIPLLGPVISLIASLWMLAAMIVAVRQALDYTSTGRAILVAFIGWVIYVGFAVVLLGLLGPEEFATAPAY
ncbi:MAG: YIP1 family protein [Pseudomonadota bacterium]|nr:YIP1 family protein [Pseudomonadota bacterium]HJO34801.1 YIP1 family protein [Gammaproteobacteria bacterium]